MRLYFEIAGHQIDGARDYQEDAFLSSYLDVGDEQKSSALVIMADGMGGHAAGNIASNLVVSTFNKTCTALFGADDVPNLLRVALAKANSALSESIRETPALDGMGCTMVAGLFHEGQAWWISVGDSHLYLIRDRELTKRNEDHSYGGYLDRMASQGMDVEPEPGLSRNMLMSAMTGDDIAEVDCPGEPVRLRPGDRVIIASDGLDTLTEGTIIQMSAWSGSPKECVDALLKAIEDAGKPRQDNATVIVVDVLDRDEGAAATVLDDDSASHEETQPLSLEDIENALDEQKSASRTQPMRPPPLPPMMEVEEEEAHEGAPVGRIVAVVLLVVLLLGGAAGAAYWYLLGGEPAPTPLVARPVEPPPEPGPKPVVEPAPTAEEKPVVGPLEDEPKPTPPPPPPLPPSTPEFTNRLAAGGEGPTMVLLAPGSFEMGSDFFDRPDENPKHGVSVTGFAMGKFEVTQAQYAQFAQASGRRVPPSSAPESEWARTPVVNVSWDDAVAYTRWLSEQTGEDYRLPSEAQWEYGASGGNALPFWWGFDFERGRAHCFDCASGDDTKSPTTIGRFGPNPVGLHDTAGNVLEWVYDCYHSNYAGAPDDGSVWEGGDCTRRVARGGAYNTPSDSLRTQKRAAFKSTVGRKNIGFRVARYD